MAQKGRFNRLLEFIGLVDDEPEEDLREENPRSAGTQSYQAAGRRTGGSARASQSRGWEQDYYTTPARPEQSARRGTGYQPTARYQQESQSARTGRGSYAPAQERYGYASQRRSAELYREPAYERPAYRDPLEAEFEQASAPRQARKAPAQERPRQANVVALRQPSQQTMIYYLSQLEECREVINDLLDGKTVLLNLEDMNERVMQRAIDTLSGAAFALGATLRKASDKTYLIAPDSVHVASTRDDGGRY